MRKAIFNVLFILSLCLQAQADIFGPVDRLRDLTDVNITTPADGEGLAYNSTTSKWSNSAAGTGDITSVGDCASAACFTGTTGTNLTFKGATSGTTILKPTAIAGSTVITLPAETGNVVTSVTALGGDASGSVGAVVVTDDSHAHGTTTLSGIDISADTNLAVTAPVVLTDDTLSLTIAKDIVAGVGLSGGEDNVLPGADADTTLTLDLTEINSLTWGSGTFTVMTFDAGITDPVITASSGDLAVSTGTWTLLNTGLHLLDTNASHDLIIKPGSDLTADKTLTLTTGDADRTVTINGDATISGTNTGDQTISDATISTSDITTNDSSTTKHGFLKKLSNTATQYMDGTGAWTVPAGSGMQYTDTRFYVGTFTRDTTLAAGTQSITGVGFAPKAVYFLMNDTSANTFETSWGFSAGSNHHSLFDNNGVSADTYSGSISVSIYDATSGVVEYTGYISTYDSDGFTITWAKTGSPSGTIRIWFLAFR